MAKRKTSNDVVFRIPIYRGPFYFGPEFLSTPGQWHQSFSSLIADAWKGKEIDVVERSEYWVQLSFGSLLFTIDASAGTFELTEGSPPPDDDIDDDWWPGLQDEPAYFVSQLKEARVPSRLYAVVCRDVLPFIETLYWKMSCRFERALRIGIAELQAQCSTPLPSSPFVRIEPQQRKYFQLASNRSRFFTGRDPCELDEAVGPSGEKLYSYGVVPFGTSMNGAVESSSVVEFETKLKKRGAPLSVDHARLEEVILSLMRRKGVPGLRPGWTREQLQKEVRSVMGDAGPQRTTILGKISPLIERLENERKSRTPGNPLIPKFA